MSNAERCMKALDEYGRVQLQEKGLLYSRLQHVVNFVLRLGTAVYTDVLLIYASCICVLQTALFVLLCLDLPKSQW
jgi:hypothetical protein